MADFASSSEDIQEALELNSLNHLMYSRIKTSDKSSINLSKKKLLPGDIWFRLHDVTACPTKHIPCRDVIKVNEGNFLKKQSLSG